VVRWAATRSRIAAGQREAAKPAEAAICESIRTVALEAGRRRAERGALEQPDDIFHLTLADLEQYLSGRWDGAGARHLVADRKAALATWERETPADLFILDADGHPAELPGFLPGSTPSGQTAISGGTLTGIGVAAGRATGKARVIRHPSEGHLLRQGAAVLLAPSTDPSWAPLFLRASAVVMEVGGYLSHGAIVAREYGIPAVVNIPGLLNAVSDGQVLHVNGDLGHVAIVPE
jgi:rifampicin phosphotransferase